MFLGRRWPVKNLLRAGRNELKVTFASTRPYLASLRAPDHPREFNDPVGGCSLIRKEQCQYGWDWGPRLVTCGIWRPLRLEAWQENRFASLRIAQEHQPGSVTLRVAPRLAKPQVRGTYRIRLRLGWELIAEVQGLEVQVRAPRLWQPNGLGKQPLYDLEIDLFQDGNVVASDKRRIGLRTIELDRHADAWGESFQFKVNGAAIFAKGANWIPAHSFVTELGSGDYDGLLTSAAEANMNMLRVWGGGIYESEEFYQLCDEKGLLVWQDFMFACAHYRSEPAFLASIAAEAAYQVQRLAHHPCLALWCGNNEIEQNPERFLSTRKQRADYKAIFHRTLPAAVKKWDGATPYWPSSPHNPAGYGHGASSETAGDAHFWDVWHARFPVKRYEENMFRFCSEFGMQSYSSPEVAATFCAPEEMNVFGPAMENHQKNSAGNQIILDYLSRRYRFPKDYPSLAYLSQLNQAYCLKVGVEHYRRSMPRTMGALYWQLNDCGPGFSWSSIEFGGQWKAAHYAAKRFFAPLLVSLHLPGDERAGIGNYLTSDIHAVAVYTVYDGRETIEGNLHWTLYHLELGVIQAGAIDARLAPGESVRHLQLDFAPAMAEFGARKLILRAWMEIDWECIAENSASLTAVRFLELPKSPIIGQLRKTSECLFEAEFQSKSYQHGVYFSIPGITHRASDNFFDLFPGIPKRVSIRTERDIDVPQFATMSLVDSY
jgi:beta-mannosidase